jgi:hypothetical protein
MAVRVVSLVDSYALNGLADLEGLRGLRPVAPLAGEPAPPWGDVMRSTCSRTAVDGATNGRHLVRQPVLTSWCQTVLSWARRQWHW